MNFVTTIFDGSPVWLLYGVTVLIVDLERPNQRLFDVSQGSMAEVARRIQAPEPRPVSPLPPEPATP